eukprot:Rmarinus@m.22759
MSSRDRKNPKYVGALRGSQSRSNSSRWIPMASLSTKAAASLLRLLQAMLKGLRPFPFWSGPHMEMALTPWISCRRWLPIGFCMFSLGRGVLLTMAWCEWFRRPPLA